MEEKIINPLTMEKLDPDLRKLRRKIKFSQAVSKPFRKKKHKHLYAQLGT